MGRQHGTGAFTLALPPSTSRDFGHRLPYQTKLLDPPFGKTIERLFKLMLR